MLAMAKVRVRVRVRVSTISLKKGTPLKFGWIGVGSLFSGNLQYF